MDSRKQTPNKIQARCDSPLIDSPRFYKTPVKQNEVSFKHRTYQNNTSCFSVLPSHITPPSGLTKFIARNPFEPDLTNRLHLSVISPTVFNKVVSPSHNSPGFAWSVDELALIQPAKIEEFPVEQTYCIDPEIEVKAQAAIDKFFDENQIIPSPWDAKRKENKNTIELNTPTRPVESLNSSKDSYKSRKDGSAQTILSLPPELPPEVEEVLKPYFTFTQEQNTDSDEANSSNSSLRRKLFCNHNDYPDDEENSMYLSPVKMNGSLLLSCSPPQSGMLIHGTPLKKCSTKIQRNHGTPVVNSGNASPPNMSPIYNTTNNMSCESIRSRSRSVVRLDFTMDMSIETSVLENKDVKSRKSSLDTHDVPEVKTVEDNIEDSADALDDCVKSREFVAMELPSKDSESFDNNIKNTIARLNNKHDVVNKLRYFTDSCKAYVSENYALQQTNALLGVSDQQSISNSAQDTGYQTYSMNSVTSMTDSCNENSLKQKTCWDERILISQDDIRLSDWKGNMKNIFCSTPSRRSKDKDIYNDL